jgi:hypothetical protein
VPSHGRHRLAQSLYSRVLIGYSVPSDPAGMASIAQKIDAERRMRDLLDLEGIPQPDAVEYGYTCIRLFWTKSKHCVIVDLEDGPEDDECQG